MPRPLEVGATGMYDMVCTVYTRSSLNNDESGREFCERQRLRVLLIDDKRLRVWYFLHVCIFWVDSSRLLAFVFQGEVGCFSNGVSEAKRGTPQENNNQPVHCSIDSGAPGETGKQFVRHCAVCMWFLHCIMCVYPVWRF